MNMCEYALNASADEVEESYASDEKCGCMSNHQNWCGSDVRTCDVGELVRNKECGDKSPDKSSTWADEGCGAHSA